MSKITNFLKNQRKYIGFFLVLAVGLLVARYLVEIFLDLIESLRQNDLASLDNSIATFTQKIRNDFLTGFFKAITSMGDLPFYPIALVVIALIIYQIQKRWSIAIQTAIILAIATGLNFLLKDFVERQRPPDGRHMVTVDSTSFPSGHAITSFAFYGFLIYILWRSNFKFSIKIILSAFLGFIILTIGYSRVYLGVHYATDVLAGFAVGGFCLAIFILAFYISHFLNNNHKKNHK